MKIFRQYFYAIVEYFSIMTINDRFDHIIERLFKGNKSAFASAIGVTPSVVDNIVGKRQGKPSFDVVQKVSAIAELNIEWLITGKGEMIKSSLETDAHMVAEPDEGYSKNIDKNPFEQLMRPSKKSPDAIPLVSVKAVGGFYGKDFAISERDVEAYYVIPKFRNLNVDFMIEVIGDSMMPRLFPGDIIACSIINNPRFIQWNKTHLIATEEQGLIVKRLRKSDKNDSLLAVSDNVDYDPFDIPINDISGLARVVGVIHAE